jgi:hypothetical protein
VPPVQPVASENEELEPNSSVKCWGPVRKERSGKSINWLEARNVAEKWCHQFSQSRSENEELEPNSSVKCWGPVREG